MSRPIHGERRGLVRDMILRQGIALADRDGIDALSMRRLAGELGVEAMSLYHHVANKGALVAGMLEIVFAEMDLPECANHWRPGLRGAAISAHRVLLRHPWACSLIGSPLPASPARLRWMDAVLGCLREGGFSPEMTHHAYHALDSHIVGFTMWLLPYIALSRLRPDFAADFAQRHSLDELPHLAEHIDVHLADESGETDEFEFGLDLILDGLERLRTGA